MLTRKQLWRKTRWVFKRHEKHDTDTDSEESSSANRYDTDDLREGSITTLQLNNDKKKKQLRFSTCVRVCLIPGRSDLKHIHHDLFWGGDDCERFKQEAFRELRLCCLLTGCSIKEATIKLYQPSKKKPVTLSRQSTESTAEDAAHLVAKVSESNKIYTTDHPPTELAIDDNDLSESIPILKNIHQHNRSFSYSDIEEVISLKLGKTDVELSKINATRSIHSNSTGDRSQNYDQPFWEVTWNKNKLPQVSA